MLTLKVIYIIRDLAFTAVTLKIGSIVYTLDFRIMTKKRVVIILKIVYKKNELYMFIRATPMKYLPRFLLIKKK